MGALRAGCHYGAGAASSAVRTAAKRAQSAGAAPRSSARGKQSARRACQQKRADRAGVACRPRRIRAARRRASSLRRVRQRLHGTRTGVCARKNAPGSPWRMEAGLPFCASCASACSGAAASVTSAPVCAASHSYKAGHFPPEAADRAAARKRTARLRRAGSSGDCSVIRPRYIRPPCRTAAPFFRKAKRRPHAAQKSRACAAAPRYRRNSVCRSERRRSHPASGRRLRQEALRGPALRRAENRPRLRRVAPCTIDAASARELPLLHPRRAKLRSGGFAGQEALQGRRER